MDFISSCLAASTPSFFPMIVMSSLSSSLWVGNTILAPVFSRTFLMFAPPRPIKKRWCWGFARISAVKLLVSCGIKYKHYIIITVTPISYSHPLFINIHLLYFFASAFHVFFPFPHFANQGIKPAWLAQGRNPAVSPHKKEHINGEGGRTGWKKSRARKNSARRKLHTSLNHEKDAVTHKKCASWHIVDHCELTALKCIKTFVSLHEVLQRAEPAKCKCL